MRCPTLKEIPPPPPDKTCAELGRSAGWPWTEETEQLPEAMEDGSPWPLISIITPNYNYGQYLEETIRSVLLQGYPNLEYVIMDGGSTDNSVTIIKKYQPWLSYWESQHDQGQSHAINKGFKKATGDIVAWINSDDFYCQDVFRRVALYFSENSNVGMIHGQAENRYHDARRNTTVIGESFSLAESIRTSKNVIAQPSTFFCAEALRSVGYLDESLKRAMDWDLWIRLSVRRQTLFFPETWSVINYHGNTKTETMIREKSENYTVVKKNLQNGLFDDMPRSIIREALVSSLLRATFSSYNSEDFSAAKRYLFRAIMISPILVIQKSRWKKLLRVAISN